MNRDGMKADPPPRAPARERSGAESHRQVRERPWLSPDACLVISGRYSSGRFQSRKRRHDPQALVLLPRRLHRLFQCLVCEKSPLQPAVAAMQPIRCGIYRGWDFLGKVRTEKEE